MLLRSNLFHCLQLPIHSMLEAGDPNTIPGTLKFGGLMLLCSKLFYCLWLPIHQKLEGGDPNVVFGSCSPEARAASQQTLSIVSGSPSIQCQRDVTHMLSWEP